MKHIKTFAEGKKLSIIKWKWIVKNHGKFDPGAMFKDVPELKDLRASCGFCELYANISFTSCPKCPLSFSGVVCKMYNHPYNKWFQNQTEENAQIVLDMCINAKEVTL